MAALLSEGHHGRRYELTGPQVLTRRHQVAAIAAGIGRPVRFEEVSPARARAELLALGLPAHAVDTVYLAQPPVDPVVSPAFEAVTGRRGRTLAGWAADHAADFAAAGAVELAADRVGAGV